MRGHRLYVHCLMFFLSRPCRRAVRATRRGMRLGQCKVTAFRRTLPPGRARFLPRAVLKNALPADESFVATMKGRAKTLSYNMCLLPHTNKCAYKKMHKKIGGCATIVTVYTPSTAARRTLHQFHSIFGFTSFTMRRVSVVSLFTFLFHSIDVKLTLPSCQTVLHVTICRVSPAFFLAFCK